MDRNRLKKKLALRAKKEGRKQNTLKKKPLKEKIQKKRIEYEKGRCQFHYTRRDGKTVRCSRNAVGKGTLCEKHGGAKDLVNMHSYNDIKILEEKLGITMKFNPDFHPLAFIELSRNGMSPEEIAGEFCIPVATLRSWTEKYQPFSLAWDIGKNLYESWWLVTGKGGLRDTKFNVGLYKFLTGNKLGYAEKIETKSMNQHVHGVLLVPDQMSLSDWEQQNIDEEEGVIDVQ